MFLLLLQKDAEKLMNGLSPHHKKTADSLLAEMSQDPRRNSVKLRNCNFAENRERCGEVNERLVASPQEDGRFLTCRNVPGPRRNSVKLRNCNFAENRVPSGPPARPEFPHFSNVTSVTAGGFFKARRRGNLHNVLPGTVQGRSQGGFLDMNESQLPSHPLPRPQPLGRFRQNVPQSRRQRRTQLFRRIPFSARVLSTAQIIFLAEEATGWY
ncbi:hypothetical protein TNCT_205411 [Trichonephila clavata]|uniref:Uncharacterized protein n=1 Tax=Trichonephila clavata TaxID=2740835 RepID=A0A8X6H6U6_TRICU|nr:hypothetical protein TNCT_205411 [Trichonephila clavata]